MVLQGFFSEKATKPKALKPLVATLERNFFSSKKNRTCGLILKNLGYGPPQYSLIFPLF
jgi:hypothetical protein